MKIRSLAKRALPAIERALLSGDIDEAASQVNLAADIAKAVHGAEEAAELRSLAHKLQPGPDRSLIRRN